MKGAYPPQNELFIRIEYVIEFILQHFDKINKYIPVWRKFEKEGLENKIAHEFALFVFLVSRLENKPETLNKLVCKALNSLSGFIRTQANYLSIINNPRKSTRLGQIHIFLSNAGNENAKWDTLIMKLLGKGYGENSERILTRLFDKNWVNQLVFSENIYDIDKIVKYSIINSRCHPIYMSVNEMYAYTHTLMYISNFGKTAIGNNMGNNHLKNTINASLLFQLAEENFDLLGEFLMNYTYSENEWDYVSKVSWNYFTSTWDNLGFLPGISFDLGLYSKLNNEEKSAYAFKEVYHTNVVAGILCTGILESKHRTDKIIINYPPTFNLNPFELNKSIESGESFYKIKQEVQFDNTICTDLLCNQIQTLINCNPMPRWFNIVSTTDSDTWEKNAALIELKIMLSIKKQNYKLLLEGMNQYMGMNLKINQIFIEAVEFICNHQIESGEFLIPNEYIPLTMSLLKSVYRKFK